jgi:GNAT superfamily N-acetyltransferase
VAPEFSKQGIEEFMKYIQPDALDSQLKGNHFALIATLGSEIIGVIEVRDYNHVSLFFVDSRLQRMGIGNELFRKAIGICKHHEVNLSQMTVNASPNSVAAYKKLGFKPSDIEQCVNGIRFVPMVLRLQQVPGG